MYFFVHPRIILGPCSESLSIYNHHHHHLSLSLPPSFRHVFRSTEGRVVCRTGPYYTPPPTTSTSSCGSETMAPAHIAQSNIYILYISSIYIHIYYIGNRNKSKSKSKSKSQTTNQEISLSRRLSSSLVVVGRRLPISSKKPIQLTVGGSPLTYAQTSVYDQSSSPTSTQNS